MAIWIVKFPCEGYSIRDFWPKKRNKQRNKQRNKKHKQTNKQIIVFCKGNELTKIGHDFKI